MIVTDIGELRKVSKEVTNENVEDIIEKLKTALETSEIKGYGLAAIQIGTPLRIAWYQMPDLKRYPEMLEPVVLINPVIVEKKNKIIYPGEGCLSLPNKQVNTERYNDIVVETGGIYNVGIVTKGEKLEVNGVEAVVCQHEIDHTNGILIIDREYKKVQGRNEKCACGSGKKFKQCCGK